jgi:hypothetical protein
VQRADHSLEAQIYVGYFHARVQEARPPTPSFSERQKPTITMVAEGWWCSLEVQPWSTLPETLGSIPNPGGEGMEGSFVGTNAESLINKLQIQY